MRLALTLCILALPPAAFARPKKPPQFPVGSEAVVRVVGDEVRMVPGLGKAKVVDHYGLVLTFGEEDYPDSPATGDVAMQVQGDYERAIKVGDPEGMEILLARGQVARIPIGTRVRVLSSWPTLTAISIPCDGRGSRIVRVTDGVHRGKTVFLPARNLAPPK